MPITHFRPEGVIPAVLLPFKEDLSIDVPAFNNCRPRALLPCQQPAIAPQWCPLTNQHRNPIRQSIRH